MNTPITPRNLALVAAAVFAAGGLPGRLYAATETSYWTFDETASPYANQDDGSNPILQDTNTDTAGTSAGISGDAVHILYNGGTTTRLYSVGTDQGSDSFGFSIFIQAQFLGAFNTIMQKETPFGGGNGYDDLAWQLHLVGDNGNGQAPLEFVVRGQNDGFAGVQSTELLGLNGGGNTGDWIHIAGGYDASTGAISLFVRDMSLDNSASETTGAGSSNMITNGAGSFSLGTADDATTNGIASYGGNFLADELRFYSAPLTAKDVAAIEASVQNVPEPGAMGLAFAAGCAALALRRRR